MGGGGKGTIPFLSRVLANEWIPPGLFFIVLGGAVFWLSRDYPLGDLNRMGPGYFPRMLSIGMMALGALILARGIPDLSARMPGTAVRFDRSMVLIPLAMVVFGLSVERIGFVAALALAIAVAGTARRQVHLKEVMLSALGLIALLVLIFVVLLQLPLRLWPEF